MLLRRRRKKNARKENNCVSIREFYLLLWSAWGNSLRGKRERERYIKRSLQRRKKDNNNTRWWEQCAVPKRAVLVRLHKLFFCFFFSVGKKKTENRQGKGVVIWFQRHQSVQGLLVILFLFAPSLSRLFCLSLSPSPSRAAPSPFDWPIFIYSLALLLPPILLAYIPSRNGHRLMVTCNCDVSKQILSISIWLLDSLRHNGRGGLRGRPWISLHCRRR